MSQTAPLPTQDMPTRSGGPLSRLSTRTVHLLFLVVAAALAHGRSIGFGLLTWEDTRLIAKNPLVQPTGENLLSIFSGPHFGVYQPLHLLSYLIDQILGGSPAVIHAHNLLLYLVGICLTYLVARRWGLPARAAFWGVMLFALHPAHVESVAWATARKDVLCLALAMGAVLAYEVGRERYRYTGRYSRLAILLYAAALLAKSIVMPLPLILLLRERLLAQKSWRQATTATLPLFAPALIAGIGITVLWTRAGMVHAVPGGVVAWATLVLTTLGHYVRVTILPVFLSVAYNIDLSSAASRADLWLIVAGILVLALAIVAALRAQRHPWVAFGLFAFLVALLPASNLVPFSFLVADRYLLLPLLGPCLLAGLGLHRWLERAALRRRRTVPLTVAALLLLLLGGGSWFRTGFWSDAEFLWKDALIKAPKNQLALANLSATLGSKGDFAGAAGVLEKAIAYRPWEPKNYADLLLAYGFAAQQEQAGLPTTETLLDYRERFMAQADNPNALFNLAVELRKAKLPWLAQVALQRALVVDPVHVEALLTLAEILQEQQRADQARALLGEGLKRMPAEPRLLTALAHNLSQAGKHADALKALDKMPPDPPNALLVYGLKAQALYNLGRNQEALQVVDEALQRAPDEHHLLMLRRGLLEILGKGEGNAEGTAEGGL